MKANENLMVGDWVKFKGSDLYHQVKVVSNKSIKFDNQKWFAKSSVKPIPLTPEILEKNGFKVTRNMSSSGNKDVWSLCVSKNKVFHIIEHHNKRKFPYFWIELGSNSDIKYVHQLQHALRLCGIEKEIVL